jgi:hypothetical protein
MRKEVEKGIAHQGCASSPEGAHHCWHSEGYFTNPVETCCWCGARLQRHGDYAPGADQSKYADRGAWGGGYY